TAAFPASASLVTSVINCRFQLGSYTTHRTDPLAAASGRGAEILVDGYTYGSLSMTAYTLDTACPGADEGTGPAAGLPEGVPADGTNI
ncbi:hypothetical protein, partial [Streptomyces sp. NPDC086766]|uniref:hypothetical protein n=1 Tax=Streptomyces sp. NPDC086766 TaxID=3365754 RepID=UPI0038162898